MYFESSDYFRAVIGVKFPLKILKFPLPKILRCMCDKYRPQIQTFPPPNLLVPPNFGAYNKHCLNLSTDTTSSYRNAYSMQH